MMNISSALLIVFLRGTVSYYIGSLLQRSAVLNVSKYASQGEINERHRSLSLIFHPDRQTDPELKETATKEFLEIQKAYQGLDFA